MEGDCDILQGIVMKLVATEQKTPDMGVTNSTTRPSSSELIQPTI
jgi:hypothetical protein